MHVYLCGAVEYSPDHGRSWRAAITSFLQEFGHQVYDPALDDRKNLTEVELREFRNLKADNLPRFQKVIHKIMDYDLQRLESRCDYVVAYWDEYASRGGGTQGELTLAYRRACPVYLVTSLPVEQVSGWILGCASEVFPDFEQLKTFLRTKFSSVPKPELAELEPVEAP
jgi:hypothetical protein